MTKHNAQDPHITYIGHATLLIEMDGVRLLTDPLLRDWVWHLRRHKNQVDEAWYQNIDAVLISHLHADHLHPPSLKLLARDTRLIVPQGVAARLRRHGFHNIEELAVGRATSVKSVRITATYASHKTTQFRFGLPRPTDCLGFLLDGVHTLYFAGDTDLFPEMADLADRLDVALLPVWGWGPTLGAGHLDPERAAQALKLLQPRLAIPIHWGTFFPVGLKWMMPHLLTEPPHTFARLAQDLAPETQVQVVPPGDVIRLRELDDLA